MGLYAPSTLIRIGILAIVLHFIGKIVYRSFFHPLRKVPGPWAAGVTFLPEFWYNIVKKGSYYKEIEKWHGIYGPIVRITPDEIHFCEPDVYDKIYYMGTKYSKDPGFYGCFGPENAMFTTFSNALHQKRRKALNPLFSQKAVHNLEWLVQSHVDNLCNCIEETKKTPEKDIDIHNAMRCVSVDILTEYAFGRSYDLLLKEDFGKGLFFKMIRMLAEGIWAFRHIPILVPIMLNMPLWVADLVDKGAGATVRLQLESKKHIQEIKNNPDKFAGRHTTIFHQLLDPEVNREQNREPPSVDDLADETVSFLVAASETTGNAMEVACFHIIKNEDVHKRLFAELKGAFPDSSKPIDLKTLEKLPFLTACIKEGLRLSYGVLGRLPRVVEEDNVEFYGYHLPKGTVVSEMIWIMHRNIEIFPDPTEFKPERWTEDRMERLERYLVPFSRGSRQCIGMNLAWAELYITIGRMIRQFDLRMSPNAVKKYEYEDSFSSFQPEGSPGLLVRVGSEAL